MEELTTVPLVVHENALNRYHKIIKWLLICLILSNVIISCLFGFVWYTSGTETVEEYTTETSSSGNATINTGEGSVNN